MSTVPKAPALRPTDVLGADVFQRETREAIRRLSTEPLLNNTVKLNVNIGTTNTQVAHSLGRVPTGWEIIDTMGFGVIRRVSWDNKFVTFIASIPNTVSIRFH